MATSWRGTTPGCCWRRTSEAECCLDVILVPSYIGTIFFMLRCAMTGQADPTSRLAAGSLALAGALTASGVAAAPLSQTSSFEVRAPCARLMPLFTAQGERA